MTGNYQQIAALVELGAVQVAPYRSGWLLTGAVDDMFMRDELEQVGAVWMADRSGYYIAATSELAPTFTRLERRSRVSAAAAAARGIRARKDGSKVYDKARAAQQRKITRELRQVYEQALYEHRKELDAVIARFQAAEDPVSAIKLGYRRAELNAVIDELAAGMQYAGEAAQRLTAAQLQESASIGRNVAAWQIDNMAGLNVSRHIAHDTASLAVHRRYDKIAWNNVANVTQAKKAVRQAISRGLLTGESPDKIARRMEGLFSGSEPNSGYRRAVTIARTETARVMSEATQETIRAAADSGLKVRNRWDATLDGDTRPSHRKVDGEIREVGQAFSNGLKRPGSGGAAESINCRCCLTPVLEGFTPDAPIRRDNTTRKTIPYRTYTEWEQNGGLV